MSRFAARALRLAGPPPGLSGLLLLRRSIVGRKRSRWSVFPVVPRLLTPRPQARRARRWSGALLQKDMHEKSKSYLDVYLAPLRRFPSLVRTSRTLERGGTMVSVVVMCTTVDWPALVVTFLAFACICQTNIYPSGDALARKRSTVEAFLCSSCKGPANFRDQL